MMLSYRERERRRKGRKSKEQRERKRKRNMNALDSPLEALALNYLSFGFLTAANNVWAWIAVITAAVSVWRIRASSPRGKGLNVESSLSTCFSSPTAAPSSSSPSSSSEVERVAAEPTEVEHSVPSTSAVSAFQTEGKTSGKFAVYYRGDEDEEEDCGNDESNDDIVDAVEDSLCSSIEWLGNGWEVTMKMRVNDMGWYHYQDLTVLDGNVVRLWDGCRRRNAAPLSMSCGDARW